MLLAVLVKLSSFLTVEQIPCDSGLVFDNAGGYGKANKSSTSFTAENRLKPIVPVPVTLIKFLRENI